MKANQNKAGKPLVFFAATATYHDGMYPPGANTTYSSPLCSYHVSGSTSLDDLVALKKIHPRPVTLIDMGGNWKPAILTPIMYMCRDSATNCSWANAN